MKIENKLDNLPEVTEKTYKVLKEKYGITARATRLLEMLRYAYNVKEWAALDERFIMNGSLDSYIIDRTIDFINGKSVDTEDIYKAIIAAGDFVQSERRMFESGHIDEIIWAIFLAITNNK